MTKDEIMLSLFGDVDMSSVEESLMIEIHNIEKELAENNNSQRDRLNFLHQEKRIISDLLREVFWKGYSPEQIREKFAQLDQMTSDKEDEEKLLRLEKNLEAVMLKVGEQMGIALSTGNQDYLNILKEVGRLPVLFLRFIAWKGLSEPQIQEKSTELHLQTRNKMQESQSR